MEVYGNGLAWSFYLIFRKIFRNIVMNICSKLYY